MNWFNQVLSKEWDIVPAGGLTGDAYVAKKNGQRLFLKRNSSPFLAVLSAEGIVPKLIWTKRLENGDVITAQEWMYGRELSPEEMQEARVAELLKKIHQSSELLHMLMRLGKKPIRENIRYAHIQKRILNSELIGYQEVQKALFYLKKNLPHTRTEYQTVCHGDLNHNNFLMSTNGRLYLIDWENATIGDPLTDYATILNSYIPEEDWHHWLKQYGIQKDEQLVKRMNWYLLIDSLAYLAWYYERKDAKKLYQTLNDLVELNNRVCS
ncbi:MAG TPA: phosphotransferase family protein [Bacillota bacterium]